MRSVLLPVGAIVDWRDPDARLEAEVALSSATASLMRESTSLGFSPRRISTMPSTPPEVSLTPKMPVWGAAPIVTRPISRTKTGTPAADFTTMFSMSSTDWIRPIPRTTRDCCRLSSSEPPALRLFAFTASAIWAIESLYFSSLKGSISI